MTATTALALVASPAFAALGTPIPLGTASTFVVLAGSGVTNTGATTLGGDIGSHGSFEGITGFDTITMAAGVNHEGDDVSAQAKTDLVTAYGRASAQTPDPDFSGVELGGRTLEPGVYDTGGVVQLTGNLTLDANGDPDAVFIFQSHSSLLAATGSSITFIGGATACHLYWRVPSSATIEAGSEFAGTILAHTTITFGAGATLEGRALAGNGAVTLDNNTITLPECSGDTPPDDTDTPDDPTDTPPADTDTDTDTDTPDDTTPGDTDTPDTTPGDTDTETPDDTTPDTTSDTPDDTSSGDTVIDTSGGTPPTVPFGVPGSAGWTATSDWGDSGDNRGRQIAVQPRGGVATGDGSSLDGANDLGRGSAAIVIALLATGTWFCARTRRAGHAA